MLYLLLAFFEAPSRGSLAKAYGWWAAPLDFPCPSYKLKSHHRNSSCTLTVPPDSRTRNPRDDPNVNYETTFACLDAGPATEWCFAVEGFLLIFIAIDELLKIYVYGPVSGSSRVLIS